MAQLVGLKLSKWPKISRSICLIPKTSCNKGGPTLIIQLKTSPISHFDVDIAIDVNSGVPIESSPNSSNLLFEHQNIADPQTLVFLE